MEYRAGLALQRLIQTAVPEEFILYFHTDNPFGYVFVCCLFSYEFIQSKSESITVYHFFESGVTGYICLAVAVVPEFPGGVTS